MTLSLLAILAVAAVLRVRWNDVTDYSPADETSMLGHGRAVLERGFSYREYCERWLSKPDLFSTPGPVRFGNIYLLALAFRITGRSTHRTMAWVSTIAGVLQVAAVYGIGLQIASDRAALFAAALAAVSPLGLAMGRRALQDAAVSATTLGATWALLAGHSFAGAALLAFLLAQKETAALFFPAVAAVCWLAGRPVWWPFPLAALGYAAAFAILARGRVGLLWRFARAVSSVGAHRYSVAHQSGPIHRLALDLFILGPVACLLGASSGSMIALPGAGALVLVLGLVPATKNVRLALPADGLIRVAAGVAMAAWNPLVAGAVLVLGGLAELWIFRRIFRIGGVYDPVTANLVAALGMAPGRQIGAAVAPKAKARPAPKLVKPAPRGPFNPVRLKPGEERLLALVMIVKDEAKSIVRTLDSVCGVVDSVFILDTGSTDGTQELIRKACDELELPLVLREEPFVDYSTTRNRCLDLAWEARAPWLLMLSGDEVLRDAEGLRAWLDAHYDDLVDGFDVRYQFGEELEGKSVRLTRLGSPYRYDGVTHEVIVHPRKRLPGGPAPVVVHYDPQEPIDKTARWNLDLQLLRREATERPDRPRTIFYLAQTYACLGQLEAAHWAYVQRIAMGGFEEERYEAMYRAASLASIVGWPASYVRARLLEAHQLRPHRAEPLYRIAMGLFHSGDLDAAQSFALAAFERPTPADRLFHDREIYGWKAADLLAEIALVRGDAELAERAIARALDCEFLPAPDRARLERWRATIASSRAA